MKGLFILCAVVLCGLWCSCSNEAGDGGMQVHLNLMFSLQEAPEYSVPANATGGLLLMFDDEGYLLWKHPVTPGIFYNESTLTFVNVDPAIHRIVVVYGEIYEYLDEACRGDLWALVDKAESFSAATGHSFFGTEVVANKDDTYYLDMIVPVVYIADGNIMKEHIR